MFKGKAGAQDAHEAIRPVDVTLTPEEIREFLTPEQFRLYGLIWSRFVASQMAAARFHDTVALITCGPAQWRARGERLLFPGWLAALPRPADEEEDALPPLRQGEELKLLKLTREQKFTQPAPRYTEASLVKELEERGIGRPSTYATIISTIQDREYVRLEDKRFVPTDLGNVVCAQLRDHFPSLMDVGFTAGMEDNLDKVADGKLGWVGLLRDFTRDFNPALSAAAQNMAPVKGGLTTDVPCPRCGKPLVVKFGKSGEFLACTGYPECRYTTNFTRDEKGQIIIDKEECDMDADDLMMMALDAGAEDFSEEEDSFEILTNPDDFSAVREALEKEGVPMAEAEITMIPQNYVSLSDENDIKYLNRTLDLLDEDDDVQAVYHNWDE